MAHPVMWVAGDGEQESMVIRKTCTLSPPQGSGNKRGLASSVSLSDTFLVVLTFSSFFSFLKQFIVCIRKKQGK